MIAIDLTSVFLCLRHEARYMLEHGGGAIVNTSSGAGIIGYPGLAPYVSAKHGVLGPHEDRGAGVREVGHPGERGLPGEHRHADDAGLHQR